MLKIRRSRDRLFFNMGIPILVRRHRYIETDPWVPNSLYHFLCPVTYLVKTPPASPNSVSFALLSTSFSVSNSKRDSTEPNTSSRAMVMSSVTLLRTHGEMKWPPANLGSGWMRSPPQTTLAPWKRSSEETESRHSHGLPEWPRHIICSIDFLVDLSQINVDNGLQIIYKFPLSKLWDDLFNLTLGHQPIEANLYMDGLAPDCGTSITAVFPVLHKAINIIPPPTRSLSPLS